MKKNQGSNDTTYPHFFGVVTVSKQHLRCWCGNLWSISSIIPQGLITGVEIRPGLSSLQGCVYVFVSVWDSMGKPDFFFLQLA